MRHDGHLWSQGNGDIGTHVDIEVNQHVIFATTRFEVSNNPNHLDVLQHWTFKGLLGHKRIIDYCLVPRESYVESAKSINGLDLGSDHRAVQCCVLLPPKGQRGKKRHRKVRVDWDLYTLKAMEDFSSDAIKNLQDLENRVKAIASECGESDGKLVAKAWDSPLLQRLRLRRRTCKDNQERSHISEQIWRETRFQLRKYRTKQTEERLQTSILRH